MKLAGNFAAARCAPAFFTDYAPVARRRTFPAGRDTAPRGEPARLYRVGDEGTRLRSACGAQMVLWTFGNQLFHFFTARFTPHFFVASVVTPPESPDLGTTPQNRVVMHGH